MFSKKSFLPIIAVTLLLVYTFCPAVDFAAAGDLADGAGERAGAAVSRYASGGASSAEQVRSVRYSAAGGVETVTVSLEGYTAADAFTLPDPPRYVIDIGGLRTAEGTLEVNTGSVKRIRFAQFDAGAARFVVDLSQAAVFSLNTGKGFIRAEAYTGARDCEPIVYTPSGVGNPTSLPSQLPSQVPGRLSVAPPDADMRITSESQPGQPGQPDGNTPQASPKRTPRIGGRNGATASATPRASDLRTPRPLATPRINAGDGDGTDAGTSASAGAGDTQQPGAGRTPAAASAPVTVKTDGGMTLARDTRLDFTSKGGVNKLTVSLPEGQSERVEVAPYDAPPRLVLDIPLKSSATLTGVTSAEGGELLINADVLKSIRAVPTEAGGVRVTLELREMVEYDIERAAGSFTITLLNGFLPNISYHNANERAFITLYGTALTQGREDMTPNYSAASEDDGRKWTISFASALGETGAGNVTVRDDLLRSVEVVKHAGMTRLVITAKKRIKPAVFTKNDENARLLETTVSLLIPKEEGERVVVIDAGHGGHDPGAISLSGKPEKDFCLDIAQKLKSSLERERGVRVFMTRDDDYFVDLYERAYLANEIGADLFVSIHANATDSNSDANGTETLYCPSVTVAAGVLSSKQFAEITQKNLMARLNTGDRSVKERPNLVVLRKTDMPAILVETAFVTNAADLAKLSRSVFRRNTANAIADAVTEALGIIGRK